MLRHFRLMIIAAMMIMIPSMAVYAEIPSSAAAFNGHSYLAVNKSLGWSAANAQCKAAGGHLVTITSKEENDFVTDLILKGKKGMYWIGLSRDNNIFQWVTEEALSYTNWAAGEPNNHGRDETAVHIFGTFYDYSGSGKWNDIPPEGSASDINYTLDKFGYICEWDNIKVQPAPAPTQPSSPTQTPAAWYKDYTGEGLKPLTIPTSTMKDTITTSTTEDIKGSSYPLLQARAVKVGKTSFTLKWNKLTGATKYIIYGNRCGKKNRYEYIKTTKKTSYKLKKLKKNKFYKYLVVAVKGKKVISVSKTVHVGTKSKQNPTKVKLNKTKVTLTRKGAGSTFTITAKIKGTTLKQHRRVKYETDNVRVAKVTKGVIKAVGPGKCNIYAYAQNGVYAKVSVTVLE